MKFYQQNYYRPYHQLIEKQHINTQPSYHSPPVYHQSPKLTHKETKQFKRSPSKKDISPYKHVKVQAYKEPVWQQLYQMGLKSQKQIILRHEIAKKKIDLQCTFKPELKQTRRYLVRNDSSFLQRVNIWQETKIQKAIRQKENQINRNLQQCTFTPHLNQNRNSNWKEVFPQQNKASYKLYKNTDRKSQPKLQQLKNNINPYYRQRQPERSLSKNKSISVIESSKKQKNISTLKPNKSLSKLIINEGELKNIRKIIKNQLQRLQV